MLGSALGGAGRYWCSNLVERCFGEDFPWGTLIVNIVGSFIIGLLHSLTTADGLPVMDAPTRQFLMAGFCGGYTTFSAFNVQTLGLLQNGRPRAAGANVAGSVVACMIAVWLGHLAAIALNWTTGR
jgi:fluoride exporter